MANAKEIRKVTIEVLLTEAEARYLKGLLQNPPPSGEGIEARDCRESIWSALNKIVR